MSFVKSVVSTYGLLAGANWMSNFVLHPTQKLDYGFVNEYLGRPVGNKWWGTKTEHILTIAAPLAFVDVLFAKILAQRAGVEKLSWKATPGYSILHGVSFAFVGIYMYLFWEAAMNPLVTDPKKYLIDHINPIAAGSATMCHAPKTIERFGFLTSQPGIIGYVGAMVPIATAFVTVKGFGTGDWGTLSLTPFEKYLNGMGPNPFESPAKKAEQEKALMAAAAQPAAA